MEQITITFDEGDEPIVMGYQSDGVDTFEQNPTAGVRRFQRYHVEGWLPNLFDGNYSNRTLLIENDIILNNEITVHVQPRTIQF